MRDIFLKKEEQIVAMSFDETNQDISLIGSSVRGPYQGATALNSVDDSLIAGAVGITQLDSSQLPDASKIDSVQTTSIIGGTMKSPTATAAKQSSS